MVGGGGGRIGGLSREEEEERLTENTVREGGIENNPPSENHL